MASAMSSRVTPPSLSTATRSTRRLPARVRSTASTSRPQQRGAGQHLCKAVPGLIGAHGPRLPALLLWCGNPSGSRWRPTSARLPRADDPCSPRRVVHLSRRAAVGGAAALGTLASPAARRAGRRPVRADPGRAVAPRTPTPDVTPGGHGARRGAGHARPGARHRRRHPVSGPAGRAPAPRTPAHVELLTAAVPRGASPSATPPPTSAAGPGGPRVPARRRGRADRAGPAGGPAQPLGRRSAFAPGAARSRGCWPPWRRPPRSRPVHSATPPEGPDDPARGAAADARRRARRRLRLRRALGGRVSASGDPALAGVLTAAYPPTGAAATSSPRWSAPPVATPSPRTSATSCPTPAAPRRSSGRGALVTERRCADVYAAMVGSTARADRQWAIDALTDSAVRELGFGGAPDRVPGRPGALTRNEKTLPTPATCLGRGGSARRKGTREIGFPVSRTSRLRCGRRRTSAASASPGSG